MNFSTKETIQPVEILANDHYATVPYDCSSITADAEGNIKAGTIIPANDATAIGVLLYKVNVKKNPNGTIIVHGFIKKSTLPEAPASTVNIPLIKFVN